MGIVYIVTNSRMSGYVKIGMTTRGEAKARAAEFGVKLPGKTRVIYEYETNDPRGVERAVHLDLADYRSGGEWFRCSMDEAVRAIERLGVGYMRGDSTSNMRGDSTSKRRNEDCVAAARRMRLEAERETRGKRLQPTQGKSGATDCVAVARRMRLAMELEAKARVPRPAQNQTRPRR